MSLGPVRAARRTLAATGAILLGALALGAAAQADTLPARGPVRHRDGAA
jgi:hypothetical protein